MNATTDLDAATLAACNTPSHLQLGAVRPGSRNLETERKLLTSRHPAQRLQQRERPARLLRPHYAPGDDEGCALLRKAFTLSADLHVIGTTLHVRLDPASAPRRTTAIADLCAELNDTATLLPRDRLRPRPQHQRAPRHRPRELTTYGVLDSACAHPKKHRTMLREDRLPLVPCLDLVACAFPKGAPGLLIVENIHCIRKAGNPRITDSYARNTRHQYSTKETNGRDNDRQSYCHCLQDCPRHRFRARKLNVDVMAPE